MITLQQEDIQIYNTQNVVESKNNIIASFSSGFKLAITSISNGIQLKQLNNVIPTSNYSDQTNIIKFNDPITLTKLPVLNNRTFTQEISVELQKNTQIITLDIDLAHDSERSTSKESDKQMVFNESIVRLTRIVENLSLLLTLVSILVLLLLPTLLSVEWLAILPAMVLLVSIIILILIRKFQRRK